MMNFQKMVENSSFNRLLKKVKRHRHSQ